MMAAAVPPAVAVEGALGRTLPGVWIQPQGAAIPPGPGFSFGVLPIGYMGRIGGSRLVPIAGAIYTNVEVDVSSNYLVPQYVYQTGSPKVSLASSMLAPVNWVSATGSLQTDNLSLSRSATNSGFGDLVFVPLTASIHFSENSNLAVSTMIFAPTAPFRPAYLANLGMGEITVMPNFGYTYMWKKRGIEFDSFVGFDIYGENRTTHYTSGTMFHADVMAIQYFTPRFGAGAIFSNLTQITKDTGPVADLLDGFEGRGWGVGPEVLYVAKASNPGIALQLRWVNEFKVSRLLKGNVLVFGLSLTLK